MPLQPWPVRAALSTYRRALSAYPADFRQQFAADLVETFQDQVEAQHHRGGLSAVVRVLPAAFRDVVVHGLRERLERSRLMPPTNPVIRQHPNSPRSVTTMLDSLIQDVRYAFRTLTRARAFSLVVIASLGLGIGATTAVFSAVNGILLRPLPYPDADELVAVWYTIADRPPTRSSVGAVNVNDWLTMSSSFADLGVWSTWRATLSEIELPQTVIGARVSYAVSDLLRIEPLHGRPLLAEDDVVGAPDRVWLGYELWQQQFGGDLETLGKSVRLSGSWWEVMGVLEPGFAMPGTTETQMLAPLRVDLSETHRGEYKYRALGRLRPDIDITGARADVLRVDMALEKEYPDTNLKSRAWVRPLHEDTVSEVGNSLYVLLGAVGFVLLATVANIANLLVARTSARSEELAVRAALGAGQRRIGRQLMTESLLLAIAGGTVGLVLAYWGTSALLALAPTSIPRLDQVSVDSGVLGFAALVTLVSGLAFGSIPAIGRGAPAESLQGTRGSAGRSGTTFRRLLVTAQVAVALVLLVGAGLLINSFRTLLAEDPGLNPEGILAARLSLGAEYSDSEAHRTFFDGLLEQIRTRPEVEEVASVFLMPFAGGSVSGSFEIPGRPEPAVEDEPSSYVQVVSDSYFEMLGTPILRGRSFLPSDGPGAQNVAIINESTARAYWPDEDPIGQELRLQITLDSQPRDTPRTIIGVVADSKQWGLDSEAEPFIYAPYRQYPTASAYLLVRPTGDPAAFGTTLRQIVKDADPQLALYRIAPMADFVGNTVSTRRFSMLLLTGFAGSALLLSCLGIYGLIAFSVARRTQEIGLRMALGATRERVLRLILSETARMVGAGLVIGIVASLALSRFIDGMLYDIDARDPLTLVTTTLLLALLGLAAGFTPARRAAGVPPAEALRAD